MKRSKVRLSAELIADGSYQDSFEFSRRDAEYLLASMEIAYPLNIKLIRKLKRLIKRWNAQLA